MVEESLPSIWASMKNWFTPTILFVLLNLTIITIAIASSIGTPKKQNQHNQNEKQNPQIDRAPSILQRLKSIDLYHFRSGELNPFPVDSSSSTSESAKMESVQTLEEPQIPRSSSFLQRLKSIDIYPYRSRSRSEEANPLKHIVTKSFDPQETETVQTQVEPEEETLDKKLQNLENFEEHFTRINSNTKPSSKDELPKKLPAKMKKSASSNAVSRNVEEEEIVYRQRSSTMKEGKSKASDLQKFGDDEEVDAKADDFINRFKQQLKLQRLDSLLRYKGILNRGGN